MIRKIILSGLEGMLYGSALFFVMGLINFLLPDLPSNVVYFLAGVGAGVLLVILVWSYDLWTLVGRSGGWAVVCMLIWGLIWLEVPKWVFPLACSFIAVVTISWLRKL